MKRWLLPALLAASALPVCGAAALFCWTRLPTPPLPPEPGAVFDNVTLVVPGEGREARRTVIVREGRIAVVAPAATGRPPGGFLLPGLVDAHAHFPSALLPGERRLAAFLYLAHGVTTVRVPGGRVKPGRKAEPTGPASAPGRQSAYPGPRVVPCGPIIDAASSTQRGARVVHSSAEARAAVEQTYEAGFACVGAGLELGKDALDAVRSAAARRSLPLVGPVPRRVHWDDAGLDDAQQLHGFALKAVDALPAREPLWRRDFLAIDREHIFERAGAASWNNMAVTPMLVMHQRLLNALAADEAGAGRAARMPPELELLPPWRRVWAQPFLRIDTKQSPLRISSADLGWLKSARRRMFDVVLQLHNSGVPVHTGSNAGAPGLVPGAALHRELALLLKAGLSPEQVLAASMVASARAMGVPRLGELAPGAPADLLLFREDPTRDLEHLATLEAVVSGGLLYTREALAAGIRAYQERYREFGPRTLARGVRSFMRLPGRAQAATTRNAGVAMHAHSGADVKPAHAKPDGHWAKRLRAECAGHRSFSEVCGPGFVGVLMRAFVPAFEAPASSAP